MSKAALKDVLHLGFDACEETLRTSRRAFQRDITSIYSEDPFLCEVNNVLRGSSQRSVDLVLNEALLPYLERVITPDCALQAFAQLTISFRDLYLQGNVDCEVLAYCVSILMVKVSGTEPEVGEFLFSEFHSVFAFSEVALRNCLLCFIRHKQVFQSHEATLLKMLDSCFPKNQPWEILYLRLKLSGEQIYYKNLNPFDITCKFIEAYQTGDLELALCISKLLLFLDVSDELHAFLLKEIKIEFIPNEMGSVHSVVEYVQFGKCMIPKLDMSRLGNNSVSKETENVDEVCEKGFHANKELHGIFLLLICRYMVKTRNFHSWEDLREHVNHPMNSDGVDMFFNKSFEDLRERDDVDNFPVSDVDMRILMKLLVQKGFRNQAINMSAEGEANSILGAGQFGTVIKAIWGDEEKVNNYSVAVKAISMSEHSLARIFSEVKCLSQVRFSPFITQLLDFYSEDNEFILVFKLYDGTVKRKLIEMTEVENNETLNNHGVVVNGSEKERLSFLLGVFAQVLSAVEDLHEKNIIHFDLKCDNLFMEGSTSVVLGDFGESSLGGYQTLGDKGTECIKSPEMISGKFPVGKPSDIWSLGCLLYEILTGRFLYGNLEFPEFFIRLTTSSEDALTLKDKEFLFDGNKLLIEFIESILIKDPAKRPDISQVIRNFQVLCKKLHLNDELNVERFLPIYRENKLLSLVVQNTENSKDEKDKADDGNEKEDKEKEAKEKEAKEEKEKKKKTVGNIQFIGENEYGEYLYEMFYGSGERRIQFTENIEIFLLPNLKSHYRDQIDHFCVVDCRSCENTLDFFDTNQFKYIWDLTAFGSDCDKFRKFQEFIRFIYYSSQTEGSSGVVVRPRMCLVDSLDSPDGLSLMLLLCLFCKLNQTDDVIAMFGFLQSRLFLRFDSATTFKLLFKRCLQVLKPEFTTQVKSLGKTCMSCPCGNVEVCLEFDSTSTIQEIDVPMSEDKISHMPLVSTGKGWWVVTNKNEKPREAEQEENKQENAIVTEEILTESEGAEESWIWSKPDDLNLIIDSSDPMGERIPLSENLLSRKYQCRFCQFTTHIVVAESSKLSSVSAVGFNNRMIRSNGVRKLKF